MKAVLTAACLFSLLCIPASAQRVELTMAIDLQARETTFTYRLWGDAHSGGCAGFFAIGEYAGQAVFGPPFVGTVLVGGKGDFSPPFTLDARGYGSYQVRMSSLALGNNPSAVQGAWLGFGGSIFLTDNYVLTDHWTNADASQILAAQFNSESRGFQLRGRYRPGVEMIVWRRGAGESRWNAVATHSAGLSANVTLDVTIGPPTWGVIEVRHGATVLLELK